MTNPCFRFEESILPSKSQKLTFQFILQKSLILRKFFFLLALVTGFWRVFQCMFLLRTATLITSSATAGSAKGCVILYWIILESFKDAFRTNKYFSSNIINKQSKMTSKKLPNSWEFLSILICACTNQKQPSSFIFMYKIWACLCLSRSVLLLSWESDS